MGIIIDEISTVHVNDEEVHVIQILLEVCRDILKGEC